MFCFICLPAKTGGPEAARVRRARPRCVARGEHRPSGRVVDHDCIDPAFRACRDCRTLVVGLTQH